MPQTQSDLARIRENQRRSRARKKEYVNEIESKVRKCEDQGVEASLDLQAAARRVLEENLKLRALLRLHGVPDEVIEEYLRNDNDSPDRGKEIAQGEAGHDLTAALQKRMCRTNSAAYQTGVKETGLSRRICDKKSQILVNPAAAPPETESMEQTKAPTLSPDIDCNHAVEMISIMAGGDPAVVREELGCFPGSDCAVGQEVMFDIMQRHSSTT